MSLAQQAARSAAWALPASMLARTVGLVGTLVLARYLVPAEYGGVLAAIIVLTTAHGMTTFGIGMHVVANPGAPRSETFQATVVYVGIGALVTAVVLGAAQPISRFVGDPDMIPALPLLALAYMLDRVAYIPERLLARDMKFKRASIGRAIGELTYTGVTVGLAASDVGEMSMVWGSVARSSLRGVIMCTSVPTAEWLTPAPVELPKVRRMLGFGVTVSLAAIANSAMRKWDNLLISHFYGPATMGSYNYAYNLAETPAEAVGEPLNDVLSASFPRLSPDRRASAIVRSCAMMSLIMVPLGVGLGLVAPTLVESIFNNRWADIGPMLAVLALLAIFEPVVSVIWTYFVSLRRPVVPAVLELLGLPLVLGAIAIVGARGITTVCVAVVALFALRTVAYVWMVKRAEEIPLRALVAVLAPIIVSCLPMAATVLFVRALPVPWSPTVRLAAEISCGAAAYVAAALVLARSTSRELIQHIRDALGRG